MFGALSIASMDANALLAVLPSDHHDCDEARFTAALESAFEIAAQRPASVVLIGAHPSRPEVEYGWIELGASVGDGGDDLLDVRGFWEKPLLEMAETLLRQHSAWNTFVMVGRTHAFLEMVSQAIPDVFEAVRQVPLWSGAEALIDDAVYQHVPCSDFSARVLSMQHARLLVLRVRDLGWSDLGHAERVLAVLENTRSTPRWLEAWRDAAQAAPPAALEANAVALEANAVALEANAAALKANAAVA